MRAGEPVDEQARSAAELAALVEVGSGRCWPRPRRNLHYVNSTVTVDVKDSASVKAHAFRDEAIDRSTGGER